MDEKEFENLFDKKSREKAREYNNKKDKLLLLNNVIKFTSIILFFYFDFDQKLFKIIDYNYSNVSKIFVYILLLLSIYYLLDIIIKYFSSYKLEVKYNIKVQSLKDWLKDNMKLLLFSILLTYFVSLIYFYTARNYPENWWIIISIVLSISVIILNYLLPVVILPFFYKLKTYPEGDLKDRLMQTFEKLDIEIEDIYEINLSAKTNAANAAVIGMGRTRKIILSDNLMDKFSANQIEAILCHEIGHHINNDIYKNLILQPFIIVSISFFIYLTWPYITNIMDYQEPVAVSNLALLLIFWYILFLLFTPLQLYLSRKYERKADQFAFNIIYDPMDLGKAFAKLADSSLSRLKYSRWEKFYKASHPSIISRIKAAKKFKDK